jgi:hypothetical protein
MNFRPIPLALVLAALPLAAAGAQADAATRTPHTYLVSLTQRWEADSPLGDLRTRAIGPDDVELRLWGGYGLSGTRGVILRRTGGRWSGWRAAVYPCPLYLTGPDRDTLADENPAYRRQARRECGRSRPVIGQPYIQVNGDSVELKPIAPGAGLAAAWDAAVAAGLLTLPPEVPREWIMFDGFTYVVEVRRGGEYRASQIEHTDPPETDADRAIQRVYNAVYQHVGTGS